MKERERGGGREREREREEREERERERATRRQKRRERGEQPGESGRNGEPVLSESAKKTGSGMDASAESGSPSLVHTGPIKPPSRFLFFKVLGQLLATNANKVEARAWSMQGSPNLIQRPLIKYFVLKLSTFDDKIPQIKGLSLVSYPL